MNWSPDFLPPTVTTTGATPWWYRVSACSSRAAKIADGRPLYCAEPSTMIASDFGRWSCRAVHQMAAAVEATSSTAARTTATITLPIKLPSRTPTRHGYHEPPTPCGPW